MNNSEICVLGASNIDLITYVNHMPSIGETLHGKKFQMGFGGKGANQAVMCAKLGAQVSLITKLGHDVFGENSLKNFQKLGINTRHVFFSEEDSTGVAPIFVDNQGNNLIVIVTGANDKITEEEILQAKNVIIGSKVMVCQLEIPINMSLLALKIAKEEGVFTILNPAPAKVNLPDDLYSSTDLICPNIHEAELLTGIKILSIDDAEKAARLLVDRGAGSVLITMGERGAFYFSLTNCFHQPANCVSAIDTTGAGDAFVGSLSYFLSKGINMNEAVKRSNFVASISVQHAGTQSSFPYKENLPKEFFE